MEKHYTILLHPDNKQGGYWATVPALPGCFSQGDTLGEAIALHLEGMIADGESVPEDAPDAQAVSIDIEAPRAWERRGSPV